MREMRNSSLARCVWMALCVMAHRTVKYLWVVFIIVGRMQRNDDDDDDDTDDRHRQ